MTIELTVAIGLVCTMLGAVLAFANQRRASKSDSAHEGREIGTILAEIAHIRAGVDGINGRLDRSDQKHVDLVERMAKVEASAKQAHRRIDELGDKTSRREYNGTE